MLGVLSIRFPPLLTEACLFRSLCLTIFPSRGLPSTHQLRSHCSLPSSLLESGASEPPGDCRLQMTEMAEANAAKSTTELLAKVMCSRTQDLCFSLYAKYSPTSWSMLPHVLLELSNLEPLMSDNDCSSCHNKLLLDCPRR